MGFTSTPLEVTVVAIEEDEINNGKRYKTQDQPKRQRGLQVETIAY